MVGRFGFPDFDSFACTSRPSFALVTIAGRCATPVDRYNGKFCFDLVVVAACTNGAVDDGRSIVDLQVEGTLVLVAYFGVQVYVGLAS